MQKGQDQINDTFGDSPFSPRNSSKKGLTSTNFYGEILFDNLIIYYQKVLETEKKLQAQLLKMKLTNQLSTSFEKYFAEIKWRKEQI